MRTIALLLVIAVVASACAVQDSASPQRRGGTADKPAPTSTSPPVVEDTTTTTIPEVLTLDEQVGATIADLDVFWSGELPEVYGVEYEPVTVLGGYDITVEDPPACGEDVLDPSVAAGNAFYCPEDDFVAWDERELFPGLYEDFGGFAVSLVLAHEWGHAIQARGEVDPTLPTVVRELQADCLAGAWAGRAMVGGSAVEVGEDELDVATAGFLLFRDPTGTSANNPGAHGNAFDRVGAFIDGVRSGAKTCATYAEEFPPVTQTPFLSPADRASGGNLPADEVFDTLSATLETYWTETAPTLGFAWDSFDGVVGYADGSPPRCPTPVADPGSIPSGVAYCAPEDTLALDSVAVLDPLYENFGDFGPAFVLGLAWAQKAQVLAGVDPTTPAARLQADCLVGDWAADGADGIATGRTRDDGEPEIITLSPGDLDEAIQAILFLGERRGAGTTAFERVEAFRLGFFGEVDDCL